jgi:hypothetical protein
LSGHDFVDVLRFIWRTLRRDPRRLRGPGAVVLGLTSLLLVALLVLRILSERNIPNIEPLLGTFDVVIAILTAVFLLEVVLAALGFEILRIEAEGSPDDE